jgi:hypothetical protein
MSLFRSPSLAVRVSVTGPGGRAIEEEGPVFDLDPKLVAEVFQHVLVAGVPDAPLDDADSLLDQMYLA